MSRSTQVLHVNIKFKRSTFKNMNGLVYIGCTFKDCVFNENLDLVGCNIRSCLFLNCTWKGEGWVLPMRKPGYPSNIRDNKFVTPTVDKQMIKLLRDDGIVGVAGWGFTNNVVDYVKVKP